MESAQRKIFVQIIIYAISDIPPVKCFEHWKINVGDLSLQYAKDIEARKIALTISLAYCTIKEWYYLFREQEKVPEVNQNEGELYSFGIPTYPQRLSHFFH